MEDFLVEFTWDEADSEEPPAKTPEAERTCEGSVEAKLSMEKHAMVKTDKFLIKRGVIEEGKFSEGGTVWNLFVYGSSWESGRGVVLIVSAPNGTDIE